MSAVMGDGGGYGKMDKTTANGMFDDCYPIHFSHILSSVLT